MEKIKNFLDNIMHIQIINSIVIIIVSIFLYKLISHFLKKFEEKNSIIDKKSKTYIKLTRSLIRYIFILVTCLALLQINGIDVSSVLAGVGILGVIFGLAIQDWLKDIIRGSSILSDNYFSVGDIVKYNDVEGKVLVIGLKSTKIQDLKTGYIKTVANRKIEEIDLVSNLIYITIPISYEVSIEEAEKVIENIIFNIKQGDNVEDCKYKGVTEIANSSVNYCIEIKCNPQYKLQVRRDALRVALVELDNSKIKIPYTQIDVHNK